MSDRVAALAADLRDALGAELSADEWARVQRALDFAAACHAGQRRDDGTPYLVHPINTALILARELRIRDAIAISAALLHDTLEDNPSLSLEDIRRQFGGEAADIIETATKPRMPNRPHREVNAIYFPRLRAAGELARTIKLADRLDNLRDLPTSPYPRKRRRYLEETRSFYLPLIATLADAARREILEQAFAKAMATVESLTG